MAGKPILNGRDSVRKVLNIFSEKGGNWKNIADSYYGLVIENFEAEQSIYTAVEVSSRTLPIRLQFLAEPILTKKKLHNFFR